MIKTWLHRLYCIGIISLSSICTNQCNAQSLDQVRLGVDFGLVLPEGPANVVVGTDIKYHFIERMSVGFRIEGAAVAHTLQNENRQLTSEQRLNLALLSTVNYYFSKKMGVYPFVELGIGNYDIAEISANVSPNYKPITFEKEWGIMFKTGFEHEKVSISIGYHFLPNQHQMMYGINQEIETNYLTFSLGYFVGGKRKKDQ